jgi:hypothetical protein
LRAGPSDRRRRPGVDRCPAAVAHTAGIRYRCGRGVGIVGPVNAQISSFRFFLLFTSPQVKATERVGDRDRLRGFDLSEQPRDPAPFLWMHRQHVDDVGPIVSVLVAVAHQAVSPHPALASRFPERRRSWPRRMPPGRRQADIQPLASDSRRPRAGPCSRRCGTDAARARRRGAQRRASPLLTCGSLERTTGFEPATPTLARWCSTN